MKTITISSTKRNEMIDITAKVESIVLESKVKEGICVIYCPHTTAGVAINENSDPNVSADIIKHLETLVPKNSSYRHSEGNSDAHIKSSIIGCSKTIIIHETKLQIGTWQSIFLCEFDGPRRRNVFVKILGEK